MFKKTVVEPTHADRLNAAAAKGEAAASIFTLAIDDLNAASAEALAVEAEVDVEIGRLMGLRAQAQSAAEAHAAQARSLAAVIG